MDKKLLDHTNGHLKQFVEAGKSAMKSIQTGPVGKEPRSKRELGIMMTKLASLSPEDRQSRMVEIANLMGHKGNKLDNCELCTFIKDAMLKRKSEV